MKNKVLVLSCFWRCSFAWERYPWREQLKRSPRWGKWLGP